MSNLRSSARIERRQVAETGAELRDYKLLERVGQDELAVIYRATHQTLNRPVFISLLRRHDWISNSRFQLAARLAASLSHPHLLPVIDAGHDDRYGDYMVTPYIEARPLNALLAEGPVDLALAVRIISQIATALDYIHEQQIIHRDVQPMNILVTPQGHAYLTNFSLAAAPDAPDLSEIDEADYVTPYSAPELRLAQETASPALDIYSLGAVAYHLLSNELPPTGLIADLDLAGKPTALALAARVLLRMLAPQPNLRYTTAGAAANALRLALRATLDQTTTDMEESRWEECAEWLENPLELALAGELSDLAENFKQFLTESRQRANRLHQRNQVRKFLNKWSRANPFRRPSLGQIVEFEAIASFNVYFYEMQVLYETREKPQSRIRPMTASDRPTAESAVDEWAVELPPPQEFASDKGGEIVLPGSRRFFTCPDCAGSGEVTCPKCHGKGLIKPRRLGRGAVEADAVEQTCDLCKGYQRIPCRKCDRNGNLVEEKVFRWSRRAITYGNDDDTEGMPSKARALLAQRAQLVYEAPIDIYDSHWRSAGPLSALIDRATDEAGAQSRLIQARLTIKGAMVTQIAALIDEQPCDLYLIGPDDVLVSTTSLWNRERIALVVVLILFLMTVAIMLMLLL